MFVGDSFELGELTLVAELATPVFLELVLLETGFGNAILLHPCLLFCVIDLFFGCYWSCS